MTTMEDLKTWITYQCLPRLPHPMMRYSLKVLRPGKFNQLKSLRENPRGGYSFRQFDEYKCIFVRIPKCASQAISLSLFENLSASHLTIDEYRFIFPPKTFKEYFKFTFVRNPWDRLVSSFFFLRKGGFSTKDKIWAEKYSATYDSFEVFVKEGLPKKEIHEYLHFIPQHKFITNPKGKILVDFIGKIENIAQDYDYVCQQLAIEKPLKRSNVTKKDDRHYSTYYDQEMIDIVGKFYKRDLELFGYNFDERQDTEMLFSR